MYHCVFCVSEDNRVVISDILVIQMQRPNFYLVGFQQLFLDKLSPAGIHIYLYVLQSSFEMSRMCVACVHGDGEDRMAAGSGNISNELSGREVVTTGGIDVTLSCSSSDTDPPPPALTANSTPVKRSRFFYIALLGHHAKEKNPKLANQQDVLCRRCSSKRVDSGFCGCLRAFHVEVCHYHEYHSLSVARL